MSETLAKPHVLVVDDEESLRMIVSGVLEDEGYPVTVAASGEEALEKFRENNFGLVISDIVMPGISGIELLQEIKEIHSGTQVIIMTSQASLDTAISSIRAGAYDYLIKPFEDLDLIITVTERAAEKIQLVAENLKLVEELWQTNKELKRANEFLAELAYRDGLTGLYNHRRFQETLAMEMVRAERHNREFTLVLIDVDFFKTYNDTQGHPAGDELLRGLAKTVTNRLRNTDFFARYGGEEFIIILPETSKSDGVVVSESVRKVVAEAMFPGQESQPAGNLTISLGVAAFPDDAKTCVDLIDQTDKALYQAKDKGRNCVCVAGA